MKRQTIVSEVDLAAVVVRHFNDLGAEVYQEVSFGSGGARADIVAVLGPVLHVIESKVSLGLSVIEQAWAWRGFAHRISVAVPRHRRDRSRFAREICVQYGIGIYEVTTPSEYEEWVVARCEERLAPRLNRRVSPLLRLALRDEQKTYAAAGNAAGRFWSPFKATCEALRDAVTKTPGLTMRDAVRQIAHHYASDSSASSTLHRWIKQGAVDGVALSDGRPARLYPAGLTPPQEGNASMFSEPIGRV